MTWRHCSVGRKGGVWALTPLSVIQLILHGKEDPLVTEYTLKDEPLENVKIASYLGIQISRDLSWHSHVAKVSAKGNKSLGFIRRNFRTSSKATKTFAYQTLVRPSLEYASCVWAPHLKHLREAIEKDSTKGCTLCLRYIRAKGSYYRYPDRTRMGHPWATTLKIRRHNGL